ncbi:MAG: hypothetical protein AAF564_11380 [Bacteroidota bacterium]
MKNQTKLYAGSIFLLLISFLGTQQANAQNEIGGHIGTVFPLIASTGGDVTTISDNLVAGFPMGVTIKTNINVAFDLEVVPFVDANAVSNVLFHPGVLMGLSNGFTFGLRGAFETGGAYGVTPLLNKAFPLPNDPDTAFFVELVLPVRFYQAAPEYQGAAVNVDKTLAMAVHFGIGF